MTIVQMLEQIGIPPVLGMGVILLFFVVLIICISRAGKRAHARGLNKDTAVSGGASSPSTVKSSKISPALAAAITAAVNNYRNKNS